MLFWWTDNYIFGIFGGNWDGNPGGNCCPLGEITLFTCGGMLVVLIGITVLCIGGGDVALKSPCWGPCIKGYTTDLYWNGKLGWDCWFKPIGFPFVSWSILIFDSPLIYWIYFYIFIGAC